MITFKEYCRKLNEYYSPGSNSQDDIEFAPCSPDNSENYALKVIQKKPRKVELVRVLVKDEVDELNEIFRKYGNTLYGGYIKEAKITLVYSFNGKGDYVEVKGVLKAKIYGDFDEEDADGNFVNEKWMSAELDNPVCFGGWDDDEGYKVWEPEDCYNVTLSYDILSRFAELPDGVY